MIRVDAVWMAVEPLDMRAGTEAALAKVVTVFGAARRHHAYHFANRRANRMKVLVHDGRIAGGRQTPRLEPRAHRQDGLAGRIRSCEPHIRPPEPDGQEHPLVAGSRYT